MIFGVLIGTYSSVYVASAVVLHFGVRRDLGLEGRRRQARNAAAV